MKLACTSAAFARAFDRGDLTQLEWLDVCARELECDGVVLDVRHFPRTDDDYLAQIKKMAADLGLCIAALTDDSAFTGGDVRDALRMALAIGTPLLAGRLAADTACTWSEQLERLNEATGAAKAANVTLAVRNAAGSFAASVHDCKRVSKETDSAWLRYGLDPRAFEAGSDPGDLRSKAVLLFWDDAAEPDVAPWEEFRGFVSLDRPAGDTSRAEMQRAMRRWRTARANQELNRT